MSKLKTDAPENKNLEGLDENNMRSVDGSEFYVNNKKQLLVRRSQSVDEVNGEYQILTNKPLPDLDTGMSKAYSVTQKNTGDADKYYAVILDKKYPVRLAEINAMLEIRHENLFNIMAAQVIKSSLGKGMFFAVIIEKPYGIKLSEYITTSGAVSEEGVESRVVIPMASAIIELAKADVVHGRVNMDNIYLTESGKLILGEGVSEVCGFSQHILYEDVNRAMCMKIGKGRGIAGSTDFYALGVVATILLKGKDATANLSDDKILNFKLTEGTYKTMVDGLDPGAHIKDFLMGVISDKKKDIWGYESVQEWIKGRAFNLLPTGDMREAGRPIVFAGNKFFNRKHLAHSFYKKWDEAKEFIRSDTLLRWIERSVQDHDQAERMEVLAKRSGVNIGGKFDRDDELLAQYILILDQQGPIRLKNVSVMIDGVGGMLASGFAENNEIYYEAFEIIVMYGLITYLGYEKKRLLTKVSPMHEAAMQVQRSSDWLRKPDLGFGLERCLYDLNPTLSCQSPLIRDDCVFGAVDLLNSLDKDQSVSGSIIDRQIGAFLSSRLDIVDRIRIPSLSKFPDFLANAHVQILALLSLAQERSSAGKLPGLCARVVDSLNEIVESFHNKYVREELNEILEKQIKQGYMPKILAVISNQKYLVRDRLGFRKAVKNYRANATQIAMLSNRKSINNVGYRYGLHLSVLLSFFVAIMVLMILVIKAF